MERAIAPVWSKVGIASMNIWTRQALAAAVAVAPLIAIASPARAGIGDLLVAPTRIVLDGRRGAEVILNNIGDEPATYRVSVQFRRMTEDGGLDDVEEPNATDKIAEDMIVYAPRRVTLAPHQPQAIRIAARPPEGLPDGEYRVHMLFRAIPAPTPIVAAAAQEPVKGIHFQLTPIYGVTIPIINLELAPLGGALGWTGKIVAVWMVIGIVLYFWLRMRNPSALERMGQIYGGGESSD